METREADVPAPARSPRLALLGSVLGSLGLVAIVSTLFTYLLSRELGWLIWGKLAFGAVALVVYFLTRSETLGRQFGARSAVYTTTSFISIAGVIGALAALNLLGVLTNREVDLTQGRIFSLSDQTEKILAKLDREVHVYAFYRPEEPERGTVDELIGRYRELSSFVHLHFINPERDPEAVKQEQITQSGPRLVLRSGDQKARPKDASEEEITNALVRVAAPTSKRIYFLTGHNEVDLGSTQAEGFKDAVAALIQEGYDVTNLTLYDKPAVPEEVAIIFIVAPNRELLPVELESLRIWLLKGGHLMVLLEPGQDGGLHQLLADWRIGLGDDQVVDPSPASRGFGFGQEMPMVHEFGEHPITRGMKLAAAFPTVRSVRVLEGEGKAKVEVIARTSAESWAGRRAAPGAQAVRQPDDLAGPVPIMVAASKKAAISSGVSDQTRLLVAGDHQFASNRFLSLLGNKDLFLNAVNWLAVEEDRISIRPRTREPSRLFLSESEATFIKFVALDIVPMLLLALGVAVRQTQRR